MNPPCPGMKVVLLTCREFSGLTDDDRLIVPRLEERGASVEIAAWDEGARWGDFDLVVVRSTWDYQDRPAEFLRVLETIDASGARLVNELELMRWNLDKGYLRDLESRGVPIVETIWREGLEANDLEKLARDFRAQKFVMNSSTGRAVPLGRARPRAGCCSQAGDW